jgi:hypothetical protein
MFPRRCKQQEYTMLYSSRELLTRICDGVPRVIH